MLKNWVKAIFKLYDIDDLQIGGNCGCCGNYILGEILPKNWAWTLCNDCIKRNNP